MIRTTALTLMATVLMTAAGCYVIPPSYKDTGVSTDQYKEEFELVPDAEMVTEDISPIWDLGRHAFQRGTDRILVLARTTSYSEKDEDYKVIPGTLRERRRERAWIQIPGDVQPGEALKLEDLEKQFLTGFDVNNLNGDGPLNSTALMKGYIVINSMTETEAKITMHIEIRPNRPFLGKDWVIKGEHTVKVYPNGHYATYTVKRKDAVVVGDRKGGVVPENTDTNNTSSNADTNTNTSQANANDNTSNNTDAGNNTTNNNTTDNGTTGDTTNVATKKTFGPEDMVGRWFVRTPEFDYRLQLEKDGMFILATVRGDGVTDDYAPGMRYGYYTFKNSRTASWIVFDIKEFRFDKKDHLEHLEENPTMAKVEFDGKTLVLTGKFIGKKTQRIALEKTGFQDMNIVLPSRGRRNVPGERNPMPFKGKLQASDTN